MKKLSLLLTCITLCVLCGCKKQGEPYSPENSKAVEYVSDCIGNKYPVVKIGNQLWMAENLKCDKYDTESESFGKDVVCYKLSDELLKEAELKRTEKKNHFHISAIYMTGIQLLELVVMVILISNRVFALMVITFQQ